MPAEKRSTAFPRCAVREHPSEPKVLVLRPTSGWKGVEWRELWEYRELFYFLAWRDIRVRYKQTAIGVAWILLQPLLTMLIFTIVFGQLGNMPSDGVPYALFTLTALIPWTFFSGGLTHTVNSVVDNAHLVTKVYFPRLIVPVAATASRLVDFALAFTLLAGMLLAYRIAPTFKLLVLPALVLLTMATSLGVGLWLSAINVQFRDVKYAVPFVSQLWLFSTPVAYPSSLFPHPWRTLYGINPMVGVVEGFRWSLLDVEALSGGTIVLSTVVALTLLVSGTYYFSRTERTFADVV